MKKPFESLQNKKKATTPKKREKKKKILCWFEIFFLYLHRRMKNGSYFRYIFFSYFKQKLYTVTRQHHLLTHIRYETETTITCNGSFCCHGHN